MYDNFLSTEMVGGIFYCYIILGLQIVNQYCILVMWEEYHNHGTHNYSNEYGFGFANSQPFLYIEDIS